jgi:hypothetical protein
MGGPGPGSAALMILSPRDVSVISHAAPLTCVAMRLIRRNMRCACLPQS